MHFAVTLERNHTGLPVDKHGRQKKNKNNRETGVSGESDGSNSESVAEHSSDAEFSDLDSENEDNTLHQRLTVGAPGMLSAEDQEFARKERELKQEAENDDELLDFLLKPDKTA